MSNKNILIIKDWTGSGTGNIHFQIGSYILVERRIGATKINKLIVYRKPDQFSSRLGMMANLNKNNHSLSWGFTEMTLTIEKFSDQGAFVSLKTINFTSIAVENSKMNGDEEEVTFVFNQMGEFCIGQC